MRVLVVDDTKFNLSIAEGFLKEHFSHFEVICCRDPKRVKEILETGQIDILLLDIVMPELSGIDILREIRSSQKYQYLQVIMLTSMTDAESFRTCFELGANDYLKKPIDATEFRARLKAAAVTRSNHITLHEMNELMKQQNERLKATNAKLKDAQFHLIQSEKLAAIGELAAGVAHEINNPIGYVGSNLETMATYLAKMKEFIDFTLDTLFKADEEKKNDIIHVIFESVYEIYHKLKIDFVSDDLDGIIKDSQDGIQKVAEIVKSLRNFARTGQDDEKGYFQMTEMINQVLLIVRNESKYVVDITFEDSVLEDVYGNKGQISQVLLNIIMNAIQAIKAQNREEHGQIMIKTYRDPTYICISIQDDGPGIAKENLSSIFNPFFTTKEVGQGTGLGLSISHDIIENKHHGLIDVKSTQGLGTEFIVRLPRTPESAGDLS